MEKNVELGMRDAASFEPSKNASASPANSRQGIVILARTIPTATVRQVVETLLANGKVRRGYLGIGAGPVRLPKALAEKLGQETGLLLNSVEQDSPAERGGLVFGDTIVAADGEPVRHMDDLLALLSGERIDTKVSVKIVRGGQTQDVTVTIGERS